ncbi:unnamed protein product [Blepharisma stoltei]|uniref:Uncharacterized protein n=1 Tax=Blepharisma stoltei TaxID=1481888 RepID=A0AAU9IUX1_9CILI|nr:unnamed protein product [Blepharisma stoltei]
MSRPRPLSASKSCAFVKPVQLGRASIRSAQINTASLIFMRPPKFRHKKLSQESLQKDNQLWELTQEVKKLEEQQKSFINKFEVQNESLPNMRPSLEIEEIKKERDELYESKINSLKYIEKIEEEKKKMQESYEKELKNMNEYIGLLRRKIVRSSISLTNSPQPSHNDKLSNFEDLFLKEKEKSSILYNTLKMKEKECENLHKRNDSESIILRMEQLTNQNNNYQSALAEAESEIKRLHQEIANKNEQIFQKKQKIEEFEIQNSVAHAYEEIKLKLKKSYEEKRQLEEEMKRNSLKSDELEKIIEELGKSLLTMTKELEDRNSECQKLENELEELKYTDKNSEKNIEREKEECLKMIEIVANKINQEISGLMLRVEQAEDQVDKILEFFEEFKSWIDQNINNQSMKNDENLLKELAKLREENDELINKLGIQMSKKMNYEGEVNKMKLLVKDYENQISIYKENSKLENSKSENEEKNSDSKQQILVESENLRQEYENLNEICEEKKEEIENLNNKLQTLEAKLKESQSAFNSLKMKNKEKEDKYINLQQTSIENLEKIEKLTIENTELKDQIASINHQFDKLSEKLKELNQQLRDKEIEADEANQLYEALKSKTEEILREQLKMKFESQNIKDEFENEKIRLQEQINKAIEEKTQEVEILQKAIKEQQDEFERQLSELKWECQQENVNTELEQKNNEIRILKEEYNGIIKRNEKELKESYEKEINKLKTTSEASHNELMGKYIDAKNKYDKSLEDIQGFEALKQEVAFVQGELREKEKEINKLREELFEADEKIENLEKNRSIQEGAVSEYKKQLESQEKEIIGLHDELDSHKHRKNSNSIENNTKLAELEDQLDSLKQENENLREKLAKSFSDPEIASMQSQISHLTQNLEKTEIELLRKSEIEEELRILEDKYNNKSQKLTVLKNVCSELEVVNSTLRTSKVEIEGELGKKEKIIKDMQREFGAQNVEVNKVKQRADQFEDLYNSLYAEMEEKNKKIENLEKELEEQRDLKRAVNLGIENIENIEIYGEMNISDEENEKDNSREESQKDNSENHKENADEDKQKLQQRINELNDDIELLLRNEEKYKIIIGKLQEKLSEESDPEGLKGRIEDLEAQLGDYQYRYDQLFEEHEELINNQKSRLDTSQDEASVQMLSDELSKVINEKNELEMEIDALRDLHSENEKIKHYQQEAENIAKICQELEKTKEDLEENYNDNLKMLKAKYEEFIKQRMEEITDQYDELQENANRLELEKDELQKELSFEKEKNSDLQEKLYKYLNKNN